MSGRAAHAGGHAQPLGAECLRRKLGSNLEQRYSLNGRAAEVNHELQTGQAPPGNRDLMRANPNWAFGNGVIAKNGYSNTHALQAEVERRYSSGLKI